MEGRNWEIRELPDKIIREPSMMKPLRQRMLRMFSRIQGAKAATACGCLVRPGGASGFSPRCAVRIEPSEDAWLKKNGDALHGQDTGPGPLLPRGSREAAQDDSE
jgi:hypothetical protein